MGTSKKRKSPPGRENASEKPPAHSTRAKTMGQPPYTDEVVSGGAKRKAATPAPAKSKSTSKKAARPAKKSTPAVPATPAQQEVTLAAMRSSPPVLNPRRLTTPSDTFSDLLGPPASSPAPRAILYDIFIQFLIRVNGDKTDSQPPGEAISRAFFELSTVEDKVKSMMEGGLVKAELARRAYRVSARILQYRINHPKGGGWQTLTLEDFGVNKEVKLLSSMDNQVGQLKGVEKVEIRVEVKLVCGALAKAFPRNRGVNEPSSNRPESPAPGEKLPRRTQQLVNEQKARQRIEDITKARVGQSNIQRMWECRVQTCNNYQHVCYVHQATHEHFAVQPADQESWAQKILEGTAYVNQPPLELIQYWQSLTGNQLKQNPNLGRRKKRRDSSSGEEAEMRRMFKEMEKRRIREQLVRMQEAEDERAEAREMRKQARETQQQLLQQQQLAYRLSAMLGPLGTNIQPIPSPYTQPIAPRALVPGIRPMTPMTRTLPVLTSSPIAGTGIADSRAMVKEFFKWLVAEQPEEDREDFVQAQQVAIEQRWTVKDLKEMSVPQSELYIVATGSPYRLKDGIVRHFHEELRRFKQVH